MDGDSLDIFGAGSFTMSIAPDGTQVGFRQSILREAFDGRFGAGTVERVLREAIQVWVPHAAIDIGLVPDDGTPVGALGPWRGDERFGDIRVFGFDLPDTIWASAISGDARSIGTWAGDIVFNTAQPWEDVEMLRSAAIHEIGHTLGLKHNDDPASPMHQRGPFISNDPLATDIAILQALHGPRRPDISDSESPNDEIGSASEIEGHVVQTEDAEDFDGSQQWIQFGDLTTVEDVDYYVVEMADNYRGSLAFAVQTSGFSVAEVAVQLVDRDHTLIASGTVRPNGDWLMLQTERLDDHEEYFLRISATAEGTQSIGTYAIFVGTPDQLQISKDEITQWARKAYQWYQTNERTEDGFSYHLRDTFFSGLWDNDGNRNDTASGAVELPMVVDSTLRIKFAAVGTISDLDDIDAYRFRLPEALPAGSSLTVDIQSLDYRGLVPNVRLVDHDGRDVGARLVARGNGLTQLRLDAPVPDMEYFVFLDGADVADRFRSGNFSLTVEVRKIATPERSLIDVVLGAEQRFVERTLYVAQTQLASFRLSSQLISLPNLSTSPSVIMRVYDESFKLWKSSAVRIDDLHTLPGVLLEAGTYFVQLTLVSDGNQLPDVQVGLDGLFPSNPVGPLIASLDDEPLFECSIGGGFCYPDGTQTGMTTIIGIDAPPPLPEPPSLSPLLPADGWFWQNSLLPTNPINQWDVNGDSIVTPLDALLVLNYISRNSAGQYPNHFVGHLDVNGDNMVTPLDALLVLTRMSRFF